MLNKIIYALFWLLALSGAATAAPRAFIDNKDGTITDRQTLLIWQKNDDGQIRILEDANKYCQTLSIGGYSDWHLPSRDELISLWDNAGAKNNLRKKYFPSMKPSYYWSSIIGNRDKNTRAFGWGVSFQDGYAGDDDVPFEAYTRCVSNGLIINK